MSVTSHTTQDVKAAKADVLQSVVSHVLPYQHIEVSEADADSKKKKCCQRTITPSSTWDIGLNIVEPC